MKKPQSVLNKKGKKPKKKLRVSFSENVSQREFLSSGKSYSDIQSKQLDSHKDLSKQWEEIDALDKQEKEIKNNYSKVTEEISKKNKASEYYEQHPKTMIIHTILYKKFPKFFQSIFIQNHKRMQSYMGLELEAMENIKKEIDTNYKRVINTKGLKIDTLIRTIENSFGEENQAPEKKLKSYQTELESLNKNNALYDLKKQIFEEKIEKIRDFKSYYKTHNELKKVATTLETLDKSDYREKCTKILSNLEKLNTDLKKIMKSGKEIDEEIQSINTKIHSLSKIIYIKKLLFSFFPKTYISLKLEGYEILGKDEELQNELNSKSKKFNQLKSQAVGIKNQLAKSTTDLDSLCSNQRKAIEDLYTKEKAINKKIPLSTRIQTIVKKEFPELYASINDSRKIQIKGQPDTTDDVTITTPDADDSIKSLVESLNKISESFNPKNHENNSIKVFTASRNTPTLTKATKVQQSAKDKKKFEFKKLVQKALNTDSKSNTLKNLRRDINNGMGTITPTTLDQIIKIHGRGWLKNSDKPNAQISKKMLDIYKKTESYKSDPEVLKAAPQISLKAKVEKEITDSKPKNKSPQDTPPQRQNIKNN